MERFRVTLTERETAERRLLRDGFVKGVPVVFRGQRVSVRGEFKLGPQDRPAPYVFVLQSEE